MGTSPEFLLGITDDPRPEYALEYPEAQLVDAYRVLTPADQERLLTIAADWVSQAGQNRSTAAPFRAPKPITSSQKETK